MPPNQQRPVNGDNRKKPEPWPTKPRDTSPSFRTPPPPTMEDIQDAFAENSAVEDESEDKGQTSNVGSDPCTIAIDATAIAADASTCENIVHTDAVDTSTNDALLSLSGHVPFMGYMDEQGVIHTHQLDTSLRENVDGTDNEKKSSASVDEKESNESSSPNLLKEDSRCEAPISAEDVLQASLHFERSHPEKRFSSSLDHYYSSSARHLYPSLEDVGSTPTESQPKRTQSQESNREDSVRTTCADVIASAASSAVMTASAVEEPLVPEPPGSQTFAIAAAYKSDNNEQEEEDVKIGLARAETSSPAPAYAVASVDDSMLLASAEATVLGTSETPEEALLAKLAAEDAEMLALKRSAYQGGGGPFDGASASVLDPSSYPDQHATVVAITEHDVHPSDISNDAVRAELIGEDYNDAAPFSLSSTSGAACASSAGVAPSINVATSNYDNTVAVAPRLTSMASETHAVLAVDEPGYAVVESEATVIDGGDEWNTGYSGEATVMNEESPVPYEERKLPAVAATSGDERCLRHDHFSDNPTSSSGAFARSEVAVAAAQTEAALAVVQSDAGVAVAQREVAVAVAEGEAEVVGMSGEYYSQAPYGNHEGVAFADEEAEVVGISEEYHPAEVSGNEAQAELVGEDFSASAVAILNSHSAAAEATALPAEASQGIQAATIVGYEDEDGVVNSPGDSRASSCGTPIPDRIAPTTARAHSAPSAVGTRIDPVGTPLTQATFELDTVVEEDWMRTPSLGGGASEKAVVVMQPPRDGEQGRPAAAVASLAAYASPPAPVFDDTDCRSPASSSQPAIAVASLDAFSSAPAPAFDETDCRLVNQQPMEPSISVRDGSEASHTAEPAMPPPRSFNSLGGTSDAGSVGSTASMSTSTRGGFHKISNSFARGMEMLFGDSKPSNGRKVQAADNTSLAKSVLSRELLPWSVIHSEATNMWVATVNTNQKALDSKNVIEASKSLRAFSVVTEKQATCLAKAWSPPRMHAFSKNPACHICRAKFAVFRRACHCRNCGVAVCSSSSCSRPWPAKMCPETYNIKKESFLNVCAACDYLCNSFRLALLEGDRDKAIALHATGNINVVTPFANVKGELFYPVHCAALGGNLELLKWLVDDNCCPIKSVRVSGRCRDSSNSFTEIATSKGRSLLGIALENRNVGIVRYLVVDKGIQLSGEKDITMDTLCRNLDLVLRLLPEDAAGNGGNGADVPIPTIHHEVHADEQAPCEANEPDSFRGLDTASDGSVSDACIICFDHSIDCVATPCGHQVCCLQCSANITRCPVCAAECTFMRVFRP